jgi:hypothetical protein
MVSHCPGQATNMKNMEAAGGVAPPVGHVSLANPVAYAALNSMGGPSMLGRPF